MELNLRSEIDREGGREREENKQREMELNLRSEIDREGERCKLYSRREDLLKQHTISLALGKWLSDTEKEREEDSWRRL